MEATMDASWVLSAAVVFVRSQPSRISQSQKSGPNSHPNKFRPSNIRGDVRGEFRGGFRCNICGQVRGDVRCEVNTNFIRHLGGSKDFNNTQPII
jgi:hypothetical protein